MEITIVVVTALPSCSVKNAVVASKKENTFPNSNISVSRF